VALIFFTEFAPD